jgi:DNA invertase Pin-like site-specific DNA recombinase
MKAALYVRVSTNGHGQTTNLQTDELREFCRRRDWLIAAEYTDSGFSGAKESRPQLDNLMHDAKRRLFDAVIVYRYDRFARSLRQLVNALTEFDALGIHFISLHEGVDTSTPNGRLVFGIFASIAEFERELIRSRIKSGLAAARARGKRIGRPKVIVDRALIARLRESGASWRVVCEKTKLTKGTAQRAFYSLPKTPSLPKMVRPELALSR